MKMNQSDFEALKRDFLSVVDTFQTTRGRPINYSEVRTMWDIFHVIETDRCNETHPIHAYRPRCVAYVGHKASLYNNGYNDAHIETALKRIARA